MSLSVQKKTCRRVDMESPACSVKKQACITLHLNLWVCNWWTWSLQCCSTPSIAHKSSQVSQKGFQNKHGLLDSRVRQQSHGALSALPRHFSLPKLVQPSANCSWTLRRAALETSWLKSVNWWCTNHSPSPFAPSLLPGQGNPADNNPQSYIFIRGPKSHPYRTPISTIIIKEAFGSWTLPKWHRAVSWIRVKA